MEWGGRFEDVESGEDPILVRWKVWGSVQSVD